MHKIVVMDDEKDIVEDVKAYLEYKEYEVFSALNGTSGLSLVLNQQPSLAIIDLNMPGLSGRKLIQEVRNAAPNLPLIIASGYAEADMKDVTFDLHNFIYLKKPMDLTQLEEVVGKLLPRN